MASFLGGYRSAGLWVPVINISSTAIPRGRLVSAAFSGDGATEWNVGQGYGPGPTFLVPITDWAICSRCVWRDREAY